MYETEIPKNPVTDSYLLDDWIIRDDPKLDAPTGTTSKQRKRLAAKGLFPERIQITERIYGFSAKALNQWIQDRLAGKPAIAEKSEQGEAA